MFKLFPFFSVFFFTACESALERGIYLESQGLHESAYKSYQQACRKSQEGCLYQMLLAEQLGKEQVSVKLAAKFCQNNNHSALCLLHGYYSILHQDSIGAAPLQSTCYESDSWACMLHAWNLENVRQLYQAKNFYNQACLKGMKPACERFNKLLTQMNLVVDGTFVIVDKERMELPLSLDKLQVVFGPPTITEQDAVRKITFFGWPEVGVSAEVAQQNSTVRMINFVMKSFYQRAENVKVHQRSLRLFNLVLPRQFKKNDFIKLNKSLNFVQIKGDDHWGWHGKEYAIWLHFKNGVLERVEVPFR